ncbi:MAG TPA: THUMP domain-containing protein [Flavobacteriales bacterium]|nr:THUMP domain-containing protein [Flavobacteriales bacterium]
MIDLNLQQKIIVKTMAGCEGLLEEELTLLGCEDVKRLTRAVMVEGTLTDIYRINYASRFALSVLVNISNFPVKSYDDIYEGASKVFWHHFMGVKSTFAVKHAIRSTHFQHSQLCALKVKDAIVDAFNKKFNERPSVDKDSPDFIFHIHIFDDKCQLLIDTSGRPLYQRGYKTYQGFAPINEILAAAMVRWLKWDVSRPLVDPFCGSATLLTEAFLTAVNRPAGFYRKHFAFMQFRDFDRGMWARVRDEFDEKEIKIPGLRLVGYELNERILEGAKKNIQAIGASETIQLEKGDFFKLYKHGEGNYFLTNPPYGKRIEPMDESFFANLSSFFKHHCPGSTVGIVAPKELIGKVGFKPFFRQDVFNGEIECRFVIFELFKGSKRDLKQV